MDLSRLSDIKLVGRAVNDRWAITDEMKGKIISSLMTVLVSGEPREIVAASRVLASLDKINMEQQQAVEQLDIEELKIELAYRLAQQKAELEAKKNLEDHTEDE